MDHRPLPVGVDNFEKLMGQGYYYVDKSELIQRIIDNKSEVTLFTRPRRFGKSLNLSMLQAYFEKTEKDKSYLFDGLKITSAGEQYAKHQGKYPVMKFNFKEGKQDNFAMSYSMIWKNIMREYKRHAQILELDVLEEDEVRDYRRILGGEEDEDMRLNSIWFLSMCLEKAYGEKAIILIDEYDVPLENAYFRGFYDEMISFIRGILSVALKTNESLAFAVLTGCLRISKESIFTGLNNLKIVSIQDHNYGEYFGFTEEEVQEMLSYYGEIDQFPQVKNWYDGYVFGKTEVYNPWSVINYVDDIRGHTSIFPKSYWSNTSSNSIIRDLIERADMETKAEIEVLEAGGSIEKAIHEDITYQEMYDSRDNLWNFLYFTGYLKKINERFEDRTLYATLCIPNEEVHTIYHNHIMKWCREKILEKDMNILYKATLECDPETMERELKSILMETISYHDGKEAFYHGFMSGIFTRMKEYLAVSNREEGNGRPDLVLKHITYEGKAYIMEFKVAKKSQEIESAAFKALEQSQLKEYMEGVEAEGFTDITCYGIGFFKKNCKVRML